MKRAAQFFKGLQRSKIPKVSPIPTSMTVHGKDIEDPFSWLHNLEDERVVDYIDRENEYYEQYFQKAGIKNHMRSIYKELISNEEEKSSEVSEFANGYFYYTREEEGLNFPIFCRKKSLSGIEEVFLDVNKEGEESAAGYISVKAPVISMDQQRVAFAKSITPDENYQGVIKCTKSGKVIDTLSSVHTLIFVDNDHVAYTVDHLRRPSEIYLHKIGSPESSDRLLHKEKDDGFFLDVTLSKDNKWMMLSANAKDTSEVLVFSTSHLSSKPILVHKRENGIKFFLDQAEGKFYCVTNKDEATNFKIQMTEASSFFSSQSEPHWTTVVEHSDQSMILDVDIFYSHIVVYTSDSGRHRILVYDRENTQAAPYTVPLPSDIAHVEPGGNVDFRGKLLRFTFSSPIHPWMVYDLELKTKKLILRKQTKLKNYYPEEYSCERIEIPNNDLASSCSIPVTLTRKKCFESKKEHAPILLHVYGAYGHNIEPFFKTKFAPLLNRGWTIGSIHVRGGGEKGENWHQQGTGMKKHNSFADFLRCTRFLKDNKFSHPDKICATSSSAGGLIVGNALNTDPSLFNCVVMKVPFVDCLHSMLDEELPLTICEYPEWGNPSLDADICKAMEEYDPYLNVRDVSRYPSIYSTTSTLDYQVPFWGPLKWMAKIRNQQDPQSEQTILLHISGETGHHGDGGRISAHKATAKEFAFLVNQVSNQKE